MRFPFSCEKSITTIYGNCYLFSILHLGNLKLRIIVCIVTLVMRQCNLSFIGYTQCILKQTFSGHVQNGSIKSNILECHPARRIKTKELLNNYVSILYRSNDKANLVIAEALHIHQFKPKVNAQSESCHGTLHLF